MSLLKFLPLLLLTLLPPSKANLTSFPRPQPRSLQVKSLEQHWEPTILNGRREEVERCQKDGVWYDGIENEVVVKRERKEYPRACFYELDREGTEHVFISYSSLSFAELFLVRCRKRCDLSEINAFDESENMSISKLSVNFSDDDSVRAKLPHDILVSKNNSKNDTSNSGRSLEEPSKPNLQEKEANKRLLRVFFCNLIGCVIFIILFSVCCFYIKQKCFSRSLSLKIQIETIPIASLNNIGAKISLQETSSAKAPVDTDLEGPQLLVERCRRYSKNSNPFALSFQPTSVTKPAVLRLNNTKRYLKASSKNSSTNLLRKKDTLPH
ncbi:unnamed protein product [Moneuplotes crassus]|uniref:Uncharacterized protein n=1 Tax=Euplotes crassus TaxID=5936 RepID=A0AAD1UNU1_EUPCR|nr:unnamed protein product [Moneuplotes crassus]